MLYLHRKHGLVSIESERANGFVIVECHRNGEEYRVKKSSLKKPVKFEPGPKQRKWIEELRSGKWKQCTGKLCQVTFGEDRYCCLGVLAEMLKIPKKPQMFNTSMFEFDGNAVDLGDKWAKKLKLCRQGPLMDMNDGGKSFKYIASQLEKYPERYFSGPA